jgi:hypothetical protein
MWKAMLAGACALAMVESSVLAGDGASENGQRAAVVVTEGLIAQVKTVLNLTPAQEPYWSPIEATLRDIARVQHATAATLDGASRKRLVSSAMPLLRRLDPEQKRDVMRLARALGVGSLAAAF